MCRGRRAPRVEKVPRGRSCLVTVNGIKDWRKGENQALELERCLAFYLDSLKPCLLKTNDFFSHILMALTFKTIFCIFSLLPKLCIN